MTSNSLIFLVAACMLLAVSAFGPNLQPYYRRSSTTTPTVSSSQLFFGIGSVAKEEAKYYEMAYYNSNNNPPEIVHIVGYSVGTPEETIHYTEYPEGQYCLLAFESAEECQHFADMIQVGRPGQFAADSTGYLLDQVLGHCQENNLPLMLVPDDI